MGDLSREDPQAVIGRNWDRYHHFMRQARDQGADIIVFPECGLTTMNLPTTREAIRPLLTPIPEPGVSPCDDEGASQVLRNASCAARETSLYLVINIAEVAACTNQTDARCPADGAYFYNTNVAFDRSGKIVARYRKFNLFVEPGFDVPAVPEPSTFDTDWGGRVGLLVCQDLLYDQPAKSLVDDHGITDLAYPVAWFSELPFLVASELQAGWSLARDVTLLAAGYHRPRAGNAGSGIFAGSRGTLVASLPTSSDIGGGQLLLAQVPVKVAAPLPSHPPPPPAAPGTAPIRPSPIHVATSSAGDLLLYQDYVEPYETAELNPGHRHELRLCHNSTTDEAPFCCHVEAQLTQRNGTEENRTYRYMAGVFSGVRNFGGVKTAGVKVCGIMACLPTNTSGSSTCGLLDGSLSAAEVTFEHVRIAATHVPASHIPVSLTGELLPLPVAALSYRVDDHGDVIVGTNRRVSDLLAIGIWGRDVSLDGDQPARSEIQG